MTALISALLAAAPAAEAPPPPSLQPTVAPLPATAAQDDEPPMNEWNGNVGVGLNITDGNANTFTGSASADAEYRRENDRVTLKFLWNYQEDSDADPSLTNRSTFGAAQYDYFLSDQTYLFGRLQGQSDLAADLDLRTTVAAGAGRQFVDDEIWQFRGEAGLAWIDEDFVGTASDEEYPAAALSYNVKWDPNVKWALAQDTFWYPALDDIHQMISRVDTRARYALSENLFGQLQWVWDWTRTPAAGAEPSDHTFLLTFGWAF